MLNVSIARHVSSVDHSRRGNHKPLRVCLLCEFRPHLFESFLYNNQYVTYCRLSICCLWIGKLCCHCRIRLLAEADIRIDGRLWQVSVGNNHSAYLQRRLTPRPIALPVMKRLDASQAKISRSCLSQVLPMVIYDRAH
jgi:hypothetical protein